MFDGFFVNEFTFIWRTKNCSKAFCLFALLGVIASVYAHVNACVTWLLILPTVYFSQTSSSSTSVSSVSASSSFSRLLNTF